MISDNQIDGVHGEFANPRTNGSARSVRPGRRRAAPDRDRSHICQSQRNYEFATHTAKCVACHGEKGAGRPNDALAGGIGSLPGDKPPVRTVGSFWPYATTIFHYVRRAMPYNESKSLTNDEVYAVTAYILQLNGIIGENDVINAQTLPKVRMPNRDGFITFARGK